MTIHRVSRVCVVGLLLVPALSLAQEDVPADPAGVPQLLDYSFVSGSWINQDFDDLDVDGDGYSLQVGLALDPKWHIFGDYTRTNVGPTGVDVETVLAGFGHNHQFTDRFHGIARVGWAKVKFGPGDANSDDGYGVQALLRGLLTSRLELEGGGQYVDLGDENGDDTSFLAAARFHVTSFFSVGVSGQTGGDVTQYGANIRFNLRDTF